MSKLEQTVFKRLAVVLVAVLLLAVVNVLLVSCAAKDDSLSFSADDSDYVIFYVEGMPCLYLNPSGTSGSADGITCDWSKWDGPQEDD